MPFFTLLHWENVGSGTEKLIICIIDVGGHSLTCLLLITYFRVFTICLPVTSSLADLFKLADVDAVVTVMSKMGKCLFAFTLAFAFV